MEPYDLTALDAALQGTLFAGRVRYFPATNSTNSLAIEAAHNGEAEGAVFVAGEQTAGRGRGGHAWHSAPGTGLYVSVLLRPTMSATEAMKLALVAGLAAQSAILRSADLKVDLRWPNDLMLNGRKCGGILVETATETSGRMRHAVVGIGINVNHEAFPDELRIEATSLSMETEREQDVQTLLAALLVEFERELQAMARGEDVIARFEAASTWARGKRVSVAEDGGYTGTTAGLDGDGLLRVNDDRGGERRVRSGGVREI